MLSNTQSNVVSINKNRSQKEVNFKEFAKKIMKSDIEASTRILRDILQLDYSTSEKISSFVYSNFEKDPNHLMRLMDLRSLLATGNQNDILAFIQEVFGVTGYVSIYITMKLTADNTFR